ncbi:MAG: EamA family transporter [bacterium]|nr:EamA family transporter [bacterium]
MSKKFIELEAKLHSLDPDAADSTEGVDLPLEMASQPVTGQSYPTLTIPILAALMGWIFLGEKVTFQIIIGGGLILLGIAFALFPRTNVKRLTGARP